MNNHSIIANYYACHRDEIVGFIAVRIADVERAEDMVQDLFLRLLDGHRLTTDITLPHLVYTMARNLIADYYRRRRVRQEYEHFLQGHCDGDDSLESVFSAQDIMQQMEHSLARLPEPCRKVYRLHIYGGMKVSEISQQLGENYKRIENQLGLARRQVRRQLRACI